jgi:hypothetical protein
MADDAGQPQRVGIADISGDDRQVLAMLRAWIRHDRAAEPAAYTPSRAGDP